MEPGNNEEEVGDWIPKGEGALEIGNKFCNIVQLTFRNRKRHTETGTTKEGGGNWEYKVREAGKLDPLSLPPLLLRQCHLYPHWKLVLAFDGLLTNPQRFKCQSCGSHVSGTNKRGYM